MDNNAIFWDKNFKPDEVKTILRNEANPKFVEAAALLLSRTNEPKIIFSKYLDKVLFCNNWRRIKRQMRKNKWNEVRIIFWDEVYKVVLKDIDKTALKVSKKRYINVDPDIKQIGDEIRKARKSKGWTQVELAKMANFSQQTISFVEKGYTNISVKTLKRIADMVGLRITIERSEKSTSSNQTYSESSST